MTITTALLGQKVFYTDVFYDKEAHPVCYFGKVDSVNISISDNSKFITVIDNKGRKTNFSYPDLIKSYNLIALDISMLQSIPHEQFMRSILK